MLKLVIYHSLKIKYRDSSSTDYSIPSTLKGIASLGKQRKS